MKNKTKKKQSNKKWQTNKQQQLKQTNKQKQHEHSPLLEFGHLNNHWDADCLKLSLTTVGTIGN